MQLYATGAVTMGCVHETPLAKAPPGSIGCAHIVKGYVQPLADHDFRWVFLTRFLMQQVRWIVDLVHTDLRLCVLYRIEVMVPCISYSLSKLYTPSASRGADLHARQLQGVSTVTGFLEYSLADKFTLPDGLTAESAVSIALAPMLVASLFSAMAAGWLSDRWGKRRKVGVDRLRC